MTYLTIKEGKIYLIENDTNLGELKKYPYKKDKTGFTYKLPENSTGREWVQGSMIKEGFEIKPRTTSGIKSTSYTKYLTDEEKEIIERIRKQAQERAQSNKKAESLEKKYERKLKELEELKRLLNK